MIVSGRLHYFTALICLISNLLTTNLIAESLTTTEVPNSYLLSVKTFLNNVQLGIVH